MNDVWTALIIVGAATFAALVVRAVIDVVMARRERQSEIRPRSDLLAAWPSNGMLPCQSWLDKELQRASTPPSPLYLAEAEEIFAMAWIAWGSERTKEHIDD